MSAARPERVVSLSATDAPPLLSVLTPFHRDDPSALLARLGRAPAGVEFVLLDDGSVSATLLAKVMQAAAALGAPARIIVWEDNRGRGAARNRLLDDARGSYALFLDADMLPDSDRFLSCWLGIVRTQRPDVAFGGLSLARTSPTAETALHHNLFGRSDCRRAAQRQKAPAQHTAASNLLVRRDFLAAHPFDSSFRGWGFEDTEWAMRVARHTEILHVDNPATHAGLDSAETLLRKSAEAGPNFARLAARHPHSARFAAHRVARVLKLLPLRAHLQRASAWLARDPMRAAPMPLRRAALKLYRAAHYADHLA